MYRGRTNLEGCARSRLMGEENFLEKICRLLIGYAGICRICAKLVELGTLPKVERTHILLNSAFPDAVRQAFGCGYRSTNSFFFFQSQRANLGEFKTRLNQKGMGCYGCKLLNILNSHFGHWPLAIARGIPESHYRFVSQGMRHI